MRYLIVFLFLVGFTEAQTFNVRGFVIDKADTTSLIGVPVILKSKQDTSKKQMAMTDLDGKFEFQNQEVGDYIVEIAYLGYKKFSKEIKLIDKQVFVRAKLETDAKLLKDVDINATQTRVTLKGDTTEINAGAYKVNQDANVEDLVKKMPGIVVENGVVKAQGEDVKKVLIDGKEFFGDDASMALKNLPAEVVDKIQILDKLSDQAQFTGFNDGNTIKTINIVTKRGMNNGTFGKVYAGYGTDERFNTGGNLNYFKGDRKITILGMSNNINQQNFSSQDLLGVAQSSSGGNGRKNSGAIGGMGKGGDPTANFISGQQAGVSTTHSAGINYADQWGKKVKFTGSYFFTGSDNDNASLINRTYFLSKNSNQLYNENNTSGSTNYNHRINIRTEITFDTLNTLFITPQIGFQTNKSNSTVIGANTYADGEKINTLDNKTNTKTIGYNGKANALWMHKFLKPRRTISIDAGVAINDKTGRSNLNTLANYYSSINDSTNNLNQLTATAAYGNTYSTSVTYTEPIKQKGQLYISYSPSYTLNNSDKRTNQYDSIAYSYTQLDTLLTNTFENTIITHKPGLGFRVRGEKLMVNIGADFQSLNLVGNQLFPNVATVNKTFLSVLPKVMTRIRWTKEKQLRVFYSTSTQVPSVTQLQNVVDNSNPMSLSIGNANLKQQYVHSLVFRYNYTNATSGKSFFVFINGIATNNYIANSTTIATGDTLIDNLVYLQRGAQLSKSVNLQDNYTIRSLITYGFPFKKIKCNINVNGGLNYTHSPGLINNVLNYSDSYNLTGGLVVSSNISEKIDFSVSYTPNYTIVNNSIQTSLNSNYYIGLAAAKITVMPWKGLVLNTEATNYNYLGLTGALNQNITLWNVAVGYKFLKNNAAELRLSVFDILSQNTSITRNVTETYIEDVQTKILQQYFMLTFTYNFKVFGEKKKGEKKSD